MTHSDLAIISTTISRHRASRKSATLIARWWRKQSNWLNRSLSARPGGKKAKNSVRMVEQSSSADNGTSAAGLRAAMDKAMQSNSFERQRTTNVAGLYAAKDKVRFSETRRATTDVSRRHATMDEVMSTKILRRAASIGNVLVHTKSKDDDDVFAPKSGEEHPHEDQDLPSRSERIRCLAKVAYQTMLDADKDGEICIVERSYVLTGTKLQDQSLFFNALQNLISMERKVRPGISKFIFVLSFC